MLKWQKDRIKALSYELAEAEGELRQAREALYVADELVAVKRELEEARIAASRLQEEQNRKERELEHKLGLHRIQIEQERESAITAAKLAVQEENLRAKEDQFKLQMEFMQDRFEGEVASQRKLVEQVLERLPKFERTYSTVEHVGTDPNPVQRLELKGGD